jgi:hypothetical protein
MVWFNSLEIVNQPHNRGRAAEQLRVLLHQFKYKSIAYLANNTRTAASLTVSNSTYIRYRVDA